jgi:predicted short-subunit dehydrogenase-like oxidoreductase (DUF2520 family)
MLPDMMRKPRVAIVGAGNLGTALAQSLRRAGFVINVIVGSPRERSSHRGRKLAKMVGAQLVATASSDAEVVWFCVPDSEVARAASVQSRSGAWKGKIALHSSGALTSDALGALRDRGASVASVHPLMTFVRRSLASFEGVPFAIEGNARAASVARKIIRELGGSAYSIRKQDKAAYHAWGTFASPLLTAFLATTERVALKAGVRKKDAVPRMMPILRQTLANFESFGGAEGFSGPIVRGDVDTVKEHLEVLRSDPNAREVYLALARAALEYLPGKNKKSLRRVLARKR